MPTLQPENIILPKLLAEDTAERAFLRSYLKPGMVFWDIGACYGLYTGPASRLVGGPVGDSGLVLSFEPNPEAYALLAAMIETNHLANVQARRVAVSDSVGETDFHVSSRVNHSSLGKPHEGERETIKIPTVTLDSLLDSGAEIPHVVKVDANGAEPLVLRGGKRLWQSPNPPIVICKFNRTHAGLPPSNQCVEELHSSYRWYNFLVDGKLEGPIDILAVRRSPGAGEHRNFLASARPIAQLLS